MKKAVLESLTIGICRPGFQSVLSSWGSEGLRPVHGEPVWPLKGAAPALGAVLSVLGSGGLQSCELWLLYQEAEMFNITW